MKKPGQYELKKWLYNNTIVGLKLHYYQTGTDTAATDWEMTPKEGRKKRVKSHSVKGLVDIRPDWIRVLQLEPRYVKEMEEYAAFAKKEAKDLALYEKLKKKFEV